MTLTFILTYKCNQSCAYCYQIRKQTRMSFATAKKLIDYVSMNGEKEVDVHFYGGEPFLEYDLMQKIIEYTDRQFVQKQITVKYSVSTNGTLMNRERMLYCQRHGVDIYLSVDGIKEAHEAGRGQGSFKKITEILSLYRIFPDIKLRIQAVVTPENVHYLNQSVCFLVEQGADELSLSCVYDREWQQADLDILREQYRKAFLYLVKYRANGGCIEFDGFKKPDPLTPLFRCRAGEKRIDMTPDGYLYGCSMHIPWSWKAVEQNTIHHFDGLCLGHIDQIFSNDFDLKKNELTHDKRLCSQSTRYTSKNRCCDCEYIWECKICPVYAIMLEEDYLQVPEWICVINQLRMQTSRYYRDNKFSVV